MYAWPVWWFALFAASASWPFSNMKVYSDSIEINTLGLFTNRYTKEQIIVRRWTLFPVLIDGISINKVGASGSRLFTTFSAQKLLDELKRAGFREG